MGAGPGHPGKWTGHQKLRNPTKRGANAIIDVGSKKGVEPKWVLPTKALCEYLSEKTTGSGRLSGVGIELAKAPKATRTK